MKKAYVLLLVILLSFDLTAQTWKTEISRIDGKKGTRMLKFKPKEYIKISTRFLKTDSLTYVRSVDGRFMGFSNDSVHLRVSYVMYIKTYTNGITEQKALSKSYLETLPANSDLSKIALDDIHVLKYQNRSMEKISGVEDVVLFSSLGLLILSPFICYNYKEGDLNKDLYQSFALGCTAGIVVGIGLQFAGGRPELRFMPGWSEKEKKVWSFRH